jgi:hypothetical protein
VREQVQLRPLVDANEIMTQPRCASPERDYICVMLRLNEFEGPRQMGESNGREYVIESQEVVHDHNEEDNDHKLYNEQ